VRDIATSAARDAHLGEKVRRLFENDYLIPGRRLGASDRCEESRRAAAHDDDARAAHDSKVASMMRPEVNAKAQRRGDAKGKMKGRMGLHGLLKFFVFSVPLAVFAPLRLCVKKLAGNCMVLHCAERHRGAVTSSNQARES
jgi:hypothetical protein